MIAERKKERVSPGRTQRRASRTRMKLIEAAFELVGKRGVEAVTVEDITELADVGKGTFYRHFENKEELVAALAGGAADRLIEAMRAKSGASETREEIVARLVKAHGAFYNDALSALSLLFEKRAAGSSVARAKYMSALEAELASAQGVERPAAKDASLALASCAAGFGVIATAASREETEARGALFQRCAAAAVNAALAR